MTLNAGASCGSSIFAENRLHRLFNRERREELRVRASSQWERLVTLAESEDVSLIF